MIERFAPGHWERYGKLLPVSYYLVTFTVPSELRPVMPGNRQAMELLMSCSARALSELLADPARGCRFDRSGFFGVYQSWTQDMRFHPHVHYVVPAEPSNLGLLSTMTMLVAERER